MWIPTEDVIIQAMGHPIRRKILELVKTPTSFTELMEHFAISTGKLTYHLKYLSGFIEKDEDGKYTTSSLGVRATEILRTIQELASNDQAQVKVAYLAQKSSRFPLLSRGIMILIGMVVFAMAIHVVLGVLSIIDPGTPWIIYPILVTIFVGEIFLLAWLVSVKRAAPGVAERIERHLGGQAPAE